MANGDVTSRINTDGISVSLTVEGFTSGATYAFDYGANTTPGANTPYIDVVSEGRTTPTSTLTTAATRRVYLQPSLTTTGPVRFPFSTASIPGTYISGTFVDGETVTASISGRTAVVVGPLGQSSGTKLIVRSVSGATNIADVWTGATGIFNASATHTVLTAQSPNEEVSSTGMTATFVLSDTVYVDDNSGVGKSGTVPTITVPSGFITSGGTPNNALSAVNVTANNSALVYPKVIGHFVSPQRVPLNGTEIVEVFVAHKYAKNGKPVARVTVTATGVDSGHSETGNADAMTLSTRGDLRPVYAVSLDLSTGAGFTRGELVNVNFTAYPWVGDAASNLDATADAGAKARHLGPLKRTIMDKVYARIDGVGAGSPEASSSQVTADAHPFASLTAATAGIAAANNTAWGLSRIDGGEVQYNAGTYTYATPTGTVTNGYVTLTHHSSTNRAGVIFAQSSADYQKSYMRFYDVTITRSASLYMVYAAAGNVLVMEKVDFNDTRAVGWYSGDDITNNSDVEFFDCITNSGYFSPGGNDGHSRIIRNHTYVGTTENGASAGNASVVLGFNGTSSDKQFWYPLTSGGTNNYVVAYCSFYGNTNGSLIVNNSLAMTNVAFIGNLFEEITNTGVIGEWSSAAQSNVVMQGNTFVGGRFNHENDFTTNKTVTDFVGRFNVFSARGNHRMDLRAPGDGTLTGWRSVEYSVGWSDNHHEAISYAGDQDSYGLRSNFTAAQTSVSPSVAAGFVSDRSKDGTNAGGGDYHPAAGSVMLSRIPSGAAAYPYDLFGQPISNTGSGAIGAIQPLISSQLSRIFIPINKRAITVP